jgi:23S rRNA (pseudouridine1915-N3)-methyltransferase
MAGIADYTSRIDRYAKLDFKAIREERVGRSVKPEEIRQKEANRLLEAVPKGAYTFALDPKGEMSNRISKLGLEGKSLMAFFIGGALGLSSQVVNAANWKLSLSRMTFPHEMAQLILLEQLYRAFTIQRGEKYHK